MIGILSGRGIEYDSKNLEELVADAELRSANHIFDFKINLSNTSYKKDVDKMAEAFVTSWGKNYVSADYHAAPDADKNIARENFLPLFVKDYFRESGKFFNTLSIHIVSKVIDMINSELLQEKVIENIPEIIFDVFKQLKCTLLTKSWCRNKCRICKNHF